MSFVSLEFLVLCTTTILAFYSVSRPDLVLMLASLTFIGYQDPVSVSLLVILAVFMAAYQYLLPTRRLLFGVMSAVILVPLVGFKILGGSSGGYVATSVGILIPIGISFYTFQAISGLRTLEVEKGRTFGAHIYNNLLYLSFFPQLVAGPISKRAQLLPQLLRRKVRPKSIKTGLMLIAIGLVFKACIADNLAVYVDQVFADPVLHSPNAQKVASLLFSIQIYCDFNGYCLIGMGISKLMGVSLVFNFKNPYFSSSISEFWRRWHITLGQFFREFVFQPVKSLFPKGNFAGYGLAILLVFIFSAFWHGVGMTFLIWGLIHGIAVLIENSFAGRFIAQFVTFRALRKVYTLAVVLVGWVFFRAEDVEGALTVLSGFFVFEKGGLSAGLEMHTLYVIGFMILLFFAIEVCISSRRLSRMALKNYSIVMNCLFILIFVLGNFFHGSFIYFQF